MSARRIAVIAVSTALVAGGAGGAIAAVSSDSDPQKTEDAILEDAAKRLNVGPDKLRDALRAAEDAQLDARLADAVKNGDLTQKQADALKKRHAQFGGVLLPPMPPGKLAVPGGKPGLVLPPGAGPFPGPGFKRPGGPAFGMFGDLAKALGLSDKQLFAKLRAGTSLADIANQQGKSLDDVRAAVKSASQARIDKAVKDGDLTQKQAGALLEHLDERLKHLDEASGMRFRERRGFRVLPPGAGTRPGSFVPAPGRAVPLDAPSTPS